MMFNNNNGVRCLKSKLLAELIFVAFVVTDLVYAAAPTAEENKKLQFQQFLNLNGDRDDESAILTKPSKTRLKLNNVRDEPIKLRQLIETLLEVQCSRHNFNVKLRYHSSYSKLTSSLVSALAHGSLYAAKHSNNTACLGKSDDLLGEISLSFDYDNCGTIGERLANNTQLYSSQITVEFGNWSSSAHLKDFREDYKITCVASTENESKNDVHSLKLSEQKYDDSSWTYPHDVERGTYVFLRSDVVLWNGYNSSELHNFPVNCWLTQSPNVVAEQHRRYFLSQGCPVNDNKGRGLARVHHMVDGSTIISFNMVNSLLWPEQHQRVYVHCETLSCVQSYTNGIFGVPKCPSATYCAGNPQLSHILPEHLRDAKLYRSVAGPLNVIEKKEPPPQIYDEPQVPTTSIELKCQLACAQASSSSQLNSAPQTQTVYVEGVGTKMVVTISFISFLIGMIMMGLLWFVHVRTDPKRKVPKLRNPSTSHSSTIGMNQLRYSPNANYVDNNLQQTAKLMLNSS